MYERIMKNLNIRMKILIIYSHMAFWTLLFIGVSFLALDLLATENNGWDFDRVMQYYVIFTILYFIAYVLFTVWMGRGLKRQIVFPLRRTLEGVEKISMGDLDVTFNHSGKDEISDLIASLRNMTESLQKEAAVFKKLAEGDYTVDIELRSEKDSVNKSLKEMQDMNRKFLSDIKDSIIQISTEASHIANGAQSLASGSSEQASTIEEFSASIMEIRKKADDNADIAQGTLEDIDQSTHLMQENIDEIKNVNNFIDEIIKDSRQIARVIKVVDDIAFQTNILALNAAVEAARAGQHGKGFAVVADEVRQLASKSAEAAKETSALIKKSLDGVGEGSKLVERTSIGIEQMGEVAVKNQSKMTKLTEASIEQGESITEIDKGVNQISDVIQSNSSMAEESAAAAEEMSAQTEYLNKLISRFKTGKEDAASYENSKMEEVIAPHNNMNYTNMMADDEIPINDEPDEADKY